MKIVGTTGLFALAIALLPSLAAAQSIVIDPGHGGTDPGGTGNNMEEADIVLDTSERFRDLLEADTADEGGGGNWTVAMTRDTDVFIPLAGRSDYANSIGADRFLSIHANAFGTASANGIETFSYSEGDDSAALRNLVQEEMVAAWQLTNRGNKTANFSVLRNTAMPSILHELAFVTNTGDAAKLASPDSRQEAAEAHLRALQRHYDIEPYIPAATATTDGVGSLLVQVSHLGSSADLASLTVDGEEVGTTDEEGRLALAEIAAGAHMLGVSKDGYLAADQEIEITSGEELSVLIDLVPDADEDDSNVDGEGGERCDIGGGASCERAANVAGGCNSSGRGSLLPFALLVLLAFLRQRSSFALSKR